MHIRIVCPSGPIDPTLIDAAKRRLEAWGHCVTEGQFTRTFWGRFAATDEQRLSDINVAFADPEVDAILCARGGYGLQRIIDRIHLTKKLVIGFSDITALHQLMHTMGVPSLHSIMCKHIATLPEDSEPVRLFRQSLDNPPPLLLSSSTPPSRCGAARGTLIGGNLSVLYGLQGTPYGLSASLANGLPAQRSANEVVCQPEGRSILFIEDIAERHYHIDRMMQNLRLSGVLANLSGLIVGQFTDCEQDPGMQETIEETILRAVAEYDYPVAFNFPTGHVENNLPLWLGREVELKVTHSDTYLNYNI